MERAALRDSGQQEVMMASAYKKAGGGYKD